MQERRKHICQECQPNWTNFAKSGDLSGEGMPLLPPFSAQKGLYLHLNAEYIRADATRRGVMRSLPRDGHLADIDAQCAPVTLRDIFLTLVGACGPINAEPLLPGRAARQRHLAFRLTRLAARCLV